MRSSWLYFATRSVRDRLPVLIWPAFVATARSAMNVSSVSPERCEMIDAVAGHRAPCGSSSSVSVRVPIWFSLMRIALAIPSSMPRARRSGFVTKRSSPTSCTLLAELVGEELPPVPVVFGEPVLDRDDAGTSTTSVVVDARRARRANAASCPRCTLRLLVEELARRAVERERDVLARLVAGGLDRRDDALNGLFVRGEARREAAFVADRRWRARPSSGSP